MPAQPSRAPESIRFGEDFELDFCAYALRRSGRAVKLERIPLEILLFLVEQRGRLVTRDEIVERIWGKDVFLDTDNSINGAIRKIRQVLRDDPEQPRFVQTVTGKGYRFIAHLVETGAAPEASGAGTALSPLANVPAEGPMGQTTTPMLQPVTGARIAQAAARRWPILLGVTLALILAFGTWFQWFRTRARPPVSGGRMTLAVLPFQNLTGDATQDYFSDGMTEEMITQLGSLDPQHLGVIARTSVMHYKNSPADLNQIGRELSVQYVLEGSVRRDADRIRIAAQLIQMKDQTHLWAQQYDRQLKDVLVVQNEIARQISDEIQITLGERERIAPAGPPLLTPEGYEAYDLYLKGQYFFNQRTVPAFHQAINYFQQATEKDPSYARAYAGLADTYALIPGYEGLPHTQFMPRARAAALRALELDETLPEAHTALALIVQNYDYDWQTAEKEFHRAIALNPNYATAHHWYAEHLQWRGRFDEALAESDQARRLDPLSLIIAADRGAILYYARQYDRAIEQFRAVLDVEPRYPRARMICGAYVEKGMFTKAQACIDVPNKESNFLYWVNLAQIYGRAGRLPEARQAVEKAIMLSNRSQEPRDPLPIAEAYAHMGDKENAFAWLDKAYALHSSLTSLKVSPAFDSLRGDHRFQELLRRVGLAP